MAGPYNSDGTGTANNYVPPPPIQSTFPTLDSSGNLSVDPTTLTQVAKAMEQDIATLQATLSNIQSNGLVTSMQLGSWAAPSSLGAATGNAYAAISQFTTDLTTAHQAVIDRISQSAQTYRDTEANNVATVNGVAAGGGPSPSGSGGGGGVSSSPSPGPGGGGPGAGGGGGAGSGGTGGGPGALSGGGNPPAGGGPGAGGPGGPGGPGVPGGPGGPGGGGPIVGPSPITRVPRPPISGPGDPAPGEPAPGEPAPGEPVPGEPVPPEPVVGGPVIGGPGDGAVDAPVLGGRGAGVLGSLDQAEGQMLADQMGNPGVIGSPAASEALAAEMPNAAAADATGAEAAGGSGFMPMGSGGSGQGEKERERGTWLAEGRDVWDDDDEATPAVIRSAR